jgi:hypothetical protein
MDKLFEALARTEHVNTGRYVYVSDEEDEKENVPTYGIYSKFPW